MAKRKMTARKSVGGTAKQVQLLPVSDRVLHSRTTSQSPSVIPTDPPQTPLPMDVDREEGGKEEEEEEEEEEEGELQSDDVRIFSLLRP